MESVGHFSSFRWVLVESFKEALKKMNVTRQTSPLGKVRPSSSLARGDAVLRRHLGWMAVGGVSLASWVARAADEPASAAGAGAGVVLRHRELPATLTRVPQTLLAIAHSEEGQRELGVQAETEAGFDEALRKAAAGWMRWRNLPDPEQREAIARAETAVVGEVRPQDIRAGKKLKWVQTMSAGVERVLHLSGRQVVRGSVAHQKPLAGLICYSDRQQSTVKLFEK